MSRQLLGYLVTCALLTEPLPPLAQLPARMPRRGFLRRGASARNLSLLNACWSERRELGWVEGQHIAMVSRSGVRRMRGPQAASPLTLGVDRHLASTPAVYTRRCGACASWRKRQRRTYGGDETARVARTQHLGGGTPPLGSPCWSATAPSRMPSSCLRPSLLVGRPARRTPGQGWRQARC
jgi:hypothetical protein